MQGVTGTIPVVSIKTKDANASFVFMEILIWNRKPESASRRGGQMHRICGVDLVCVRTAPHHVKLYLFTLSIKRNKNYLQPFHSVYICGTIRSINLNLKL